jgi:CRP/FNR family cyclic AMP-dependent transcriptional regulator
MSGWWCGGDTATGLEVDDLAAEPVAIAAARASGEQVLVPPDPHALSALLSLPLLADARTDDVHRLAALTWCRHLQPGQVLFGAGEPVLELHVVCSGRLKLVVPSARGAELLLDVVAAGQAVTESGVVDRGDRVTTAVALERTEVWCVPAAAVHALVHDSHAVALAVAEELAAKLRTLTGVAADLSLLDLPHRLAKLLAVGDTAVSGMPQSDLAARLGVTRQSLNRSLQRLQDQGWLTVRRGSIEVLDRATLERFSAT